MNNIWIGTSGGLASFDGKNWITYNKSPKKDADRIVVKCVAVDLRGEVWAGTSGYGLGTLLISDQALRENAGSPFLEYGGDNKKTNPDVRKSMAKWIFYLAKNSSMPSNSVKSIRIAEDGTKWIGTDYGLVKIKSTDWGTGASGGMKWMVYDTVNSGLKNDAIYALASDKQGNMWLGTFGGGVVKYDGKFWTVYNIQNSPLPDDYVISLATDTNDYLWIGTYSGGLAKFNGLNWNVYKTNNSKIPDNLVFALTADKKGNIWVGSVQNGMAKFDGTKWIKYDLMNSGNPYTASVIYIDENDNKWIGTAGGLVVFNENGVNYR